MMNMTDLTRQQCLAMRLAPWHQIGAVSPSCCLATGSRHCGRGFAAGLSARAGADQRDTAPVPPHGRGLPDR